MRPRVISSEPIQVGFQIAPMIDVVFVIMLFFMVMASAVKSERQLTFWLPSPLRETTESFLPSELEVVIEEDGTIFMNEEQYDDASQKSLPALSATLQRVSADAISRGDKVLVTIRAEERASYSRIIDVMNAMARARLADVSFTVGEE